MPGQGAPSALFIIVSFILSVEASRFPVADLVFDLVFDLVLFDSRMHSGVPPATLSLLPLCPNVETFPCGVHLHREYKMTR